MTTEAILAAAGVFAILITLLSASMWIFAALMLVAALSLWLFAGFPIQRVGAIFQAITWGAANKWELAAVPMFMFMGELMYRTDISARLFNGLTPFVSRLPGRLLHVNILGSTIFAAVSGSSAATTATVGKITTGQLLKRGYDRSLATGSLAGAGSFGLLIPPSVVLIVYGVLAEVSITRLFLAGIVPGIMLALLFSGYIALRTILNPAVAPGETTRYELRDFAKAFLTLVPVIVLVGSVIVILYSGVATPSEAGAVAVVVSLAVILATGQFRTPMILEAVRAATVTSAMLCSIIVAASFLSTAMGYLHIPATVAEVIGQRHLGPYGIIVVLALFYLLLGMFLEGTSITVMTLPITLPLATQAGWDPVWFGIFLVVMVEVAQITPPVGFNLFILQHQTGDSIVKVARAAFPFFCLLVLGAFLLVLFPEIALFLTR